MIAIVLVYLFTKYRIYSNRAYVHGAILYKVNSQQYYIRMEYLCETTKLILFLLYTRLHYTLCHTSYVRAGMIHSEIISLIKKNLKKTFKLSLTYKKSSHYSQPRLQDLVFFQPQKQTEGFTTFKIKTISSMISWTCYWGRCYTTCDFSCYRKCHAAHSARYCEKRCNCVRRGN